MIHWLDPFEQPENEERPPPAATPGTSMPCGRGAAVREPAIPAIPAIPEAGDPQESQGSQESQVANSAAPPAERAADRFSEVAAMDLGTFGGAIEDGAEGEPGRVGPPAAPWQAPTTTPGEIEAPGAAGAGRGGSPADPLSADDDPGVLVGDTAPPAVELPRGISEPRPPLAPGRLLLALADRDITVTLEGEQIRLHPAVAVTPGVLAEVKAQKPALVALLRCVGACYGPRVLTPRGAGLLRWRGRTGRLGVVLDGDPNGWYFFDPGDVQALPGRFP
jgi:hypothetical protein